MAALSLKKGQFATRKDRLDAERQVRRAKVLRELESVAGFKIEVAKEIEVAADNLLAYTRADTLEVGLREGLLDSKDSKLLIHAVKHEGMHRKIGIFSLDLKEFLNPEQLDTLAKEMKEAGLADIDLMEGFTEGATFKAEGRYDGSGYATIEVPAADKLDKLAKEVLGCGIAEAFEAGNRKMVVVRIQRLARALLLRQGLEQLNDTEVKELAAGKLTIAQVREAVRARLKNGIPVVENLGEARSVVKKMAKEVVEKSATA